MKKIILSLLLLTPLFASASTLDHDLSFGLRNNADVKTLQQFLTDQKLYAGDVNGNFFSMTQKAVKAFQTKQGIVPASGYVGSKTRAKINAFTASSFNTQPIVAKSEPVPQSIASSTPDIKLAAPQNPVPQIQTQEDPTLKIAKCQAETQMQFDAYINKVNNGLDDLFSVKIADLKEQLRQMKMRDLNAATDFGGATLSAQAETSLIHQRTEDAISGPAVIAYQNVIQGLESKAAQLKENARLWGEQEHSRSYLECLNK